jgi:uncharacterized protein
VEQALVVSDTHGDEQRLVQIIDLAMKQNIRTIYHLGDGVLEAESAVLQFPECQIIFVAGNCDMTVEAPFECVVHLGDHPILLVHGHQYDVRSSLDSLTHQAQKLGVCCACFGHTHLYTEHWVSESLVLLNPGSLSRPHVGDKASYVILTAQGDKVVPSIESYYIA